MRVWKVFLLSLLIALVVQGLLWHFASLVDQAGWMKRIVALATGDLALFDMPFFANPGMVMTSLGALAYRMGVSPWGSLVGTVALINAVVIAGILTIVYRQSSRKSWWLGAAIILLTHNAYFYSAPHDAIIAPLLTLVVILTWQELYPRKATNRLPVGLLGVTFGLAMATYITLSSLFGLVWFSLLAPKLGWRKLGKVLVAALATFLLFDPLIWLMPQAHIQAMISHASYNALAHDRPFVNLVDFITVAPMTLLALGLAMGTVVFEVDEPWPVGLIRRLLIATAVAAAVILGSAAPTHRYFQALFFIWDLWLVLAVLCWIEKARVYRTGQRKGTVKFPSL